jgi:hypothetical protein
VALVAFKQLRPNFFLERLDLGAQRRLSYVKPDGGTAEAQFLGNRDKELKLAQLHNRK